MSTEFESAVYARENHTPWASVSVARFMREMAWNGNGDHEVTLTVVHRAAVSSRQWWTLSWVAENGERQEVSGQTLDKVLWRAVELELRIRVKEDNKPREEPVV